MKDLGKERQASLRRLARESLEKFDEIAEEAGRQLQTGPVTGRGITAYSSGGADQHVTEILQRARQGYRALQREPAIARINVTYDNDCERVFYICRREAAVNVPDLASYRSPIGQLAAMPLGRQVQTPRCAKVSAHDRVKYNPIIQENLWDSHDSKIEELGIKTISISSLRSLILEAPIEEDDLLEQLLGEEKTEVLISEHPTREIIRYIKLRDQPILDEYQDVIFRLPINHRLLIIGPPGTGKTTTLIRRIGQKLDLHSMDDESEDRDLVRTVEGLNSRTYEQNWLMFTPNELLRHYLKEAFAREGVAASAARVQTWAKFRRELARENLNLLSTRLGDGKVVLRDRAKFLLESTLEQQIQLFRDFDEWQFDLYKSDLIKSSEKLASRSRELGQFASADTFARDGVSITELQELVNSICSNIQNLLAPAPKIPAMSIVRNLELLAGTVRDLDVRVQSCINTQVDKPLKRRLRVDRHFIDSLGQYIHSLDAQEDSDDQTTETDSRDENITGAGPRRAGVRGYRNALRAYARQRAGGRRVRSGSRSAVVMKWIRDHGVEDIDEVEFKLIGHYSLIHLDLLKFRNPVETYVGRMANRYLEFRRIRLSEGKWYRLSEDVSRDDSSIPTHYNRFITSQKKSRFLDISSAELDLLILASLRSLTGLIGLFSHDLYESPRFESYRQKIDGFTYAQIYVDEATDFSPIQLACMFELASPKLRSFFACGDFNQRLTVFGTRSAEEFDWAVPRIQIEPIKSLYRQSQHLVDISSMFVSLMGNADFTTVHINDAQHRGIAPVMVENAVELSITSTWVAERIAEIQNIVTSLPSIAVFVAREEDVWSVSSALSGALEPYNIRAIGCYEGQVLGDEIDVRCFDIRHIKGLEFEAVFFLDVDKLFDYHSALALRYLYVGITRAATFLGLSFAGTMPEQLESLRPRFQPTWALSPSSEGALG